MRISDLKRLFKKGVGILTEPLFLKPYFNPKIWGGRKLETEYGFNIPDGKIGEAWIISGHPHGPATIENGPLKGKTLREAWHEDPAYFGPQHSQEFPLLVKILDAEASLSVQVHPDDAYAAAHEAKGELGKTECWYILKADPGAYLIYGHHAKTHEQLKEMIEAGDWEHLLRKYPVKTGDFVYVPSGTIHALNKGIVALETQQSSDTTYRLYDYDRKDDQGHKRELHIKQSLDVTTVPFHDPKLDITKEQVTGGRITTFVKPPLSPHFAVYRLDVDGTMTFTQQAPYTNVTVLDGDGTFSADGKDYPIKTGDSFLIPNQIKTWAFTGKLAIVTSTPGVDA